MPTLLDVQRAFARFLTGGDPAAAEFVIADGIAPEARLAIYRNTYAGNLINALRISYPAVRRLVGEEFFEGAARAFIDTHPPQSAYLNEYGGAFGDFLAQFPPAAALAYLGDVARLEWAVNGALHAQDANALDPASLGALPADADARFVAHPSVRLLRTAFPADAIWRAALDEDDCALGAIDLCEGPQLLIVNRGAGGVRITRASAEEFTFAEAIFSGIALSRSIAGVESDMAQALAGHFTSGRLSEVHLKPPYSAEGTDP